MKRRLTVTIDANVAKRIERLAQTRKTSVSAVIEESLRHSTKPERQHRAQKSTPSFGKRWAGKLRLRTPSGPDPLLDALKAKYGL